MALTIEVKDKRAKWISLSPRASCTLGLRQTTAIEKDGSVNGGLVKLDRIISSIALLCDQVESSFITPSGNCSLLALFNTSTDGDNPRIIHGVTMRNTGHRARIASSASGTLTHLQMSLATLQPSQLTIPCLSNVSINLCLSLNQNE